MSIDWIEGFPSAHMRRREIPVLCRPTWDSPVKVVLLGNRLLTVLLHFDTTALRTVPCVGANHCPYCPDPKIRAEGFLAAWCPRKRAKRVAQFSDSALASLERATASRPDWRGLIVELKRADRRHNSRVVLSILGIAAVNGLPQEFDHRPSVERVWGMAPHAIEATHGRGDPSEMFEDDQTEGG